MLQHKQVESKHNILLTLSVFFVPKADIQMPCVHSDRDVRTYKVSFDRIYVFFFFFSQLIKNSIYVSGDAVTHEVPLIACTLLCPNDKYKQYLKIQTLLEDLLFVYSMYIQ